MAHIIFKTFFSREVFLAVGFYIILGLLLHLFSTILFGITLGSIFLIRWSMEKTKIKHTLLYPGLHFSLYYSPLFFLVLKDVISNPYNAYEALIVVFPAVIFDLLVGDVGSTPLESYILGAIFTLSLVFLFSFVIKLRNTKIG